MLGTLVALGTNNTPPATEPCLYTLSWDQQGPGSGFTGDTGLFTSLSGPSAGTPTAQRTLKLQPLGGYRVAAAQLYDGKRLGDKLVTGTGVGQLYERKLDGHTTSVVFSVCAGGQPTTS